MNLEEARRRAAEVLGEVKPLEDDSAPRDVVEVGRQEGEGKGFVEQLQSMTPAGFPIPGLLLFGLTTLLDLRRYGPGEKMRWGVAFLFRGLFFAFEYRKFGLRFLSERHNLDSPTVREVLGRARGLTDIVEVYLAEGYVGKQVAAGNITIENLYEQLDYRYRFLREQAAAAYARPAPPPEIGKSEFATWTRYDLGRPEREGAALATAAVDAYFSRQEHLFVLSSAFIGDGSAHGGVLEFLSANWPAKVRTVLDLGDPRAKAFYDRLLEVREHWRNPLAHGGFLSGGGSLYFHLPGVGALPARLRRAADGIRFGLRLPDDSFAEIMKLFDDFDAFLADGPLHYPIKWAAAGVSVALDAKSRAKYYDAMRSDEAFDDFLNWSAMDADRHANMDY